MIRALIIDDEPPARRHVRRMLQGWPGISVVGEASDGSQAVQMIEALHPDLVFLDIQMPEMSGLDVVSAIGVDAMPVTVFVTAYDAYAIRAFEAHALDYLLKPLDDRRFDACLKRVEKQLAQARPGAPLQGLVKSLGALSRLVARSNGKARVVPLDEIDWLSAAGDYVEAHLGERTVLLDGALSALADKLPADQFARVHRTTIVRLDRITEITGAGHGDAWLTLRGGTRLKLSRRYRENLTIWLKTVPLGDV